MNSFSQSLECGNTLSPKQVYLHLLNRVPHIKFVSRCKSIADDRKGIDYVIHREGLRPLYLDLKEVDFMPGEVDTLLLETSMSGQNVVDGWATDKNKRTDLFLIVRGDGSSVVLSARQLRGALAKHLRKWETVFRVGSTATKGFYEVFKSRYVLVPRAVIEKACAEVAATWRR